MDMSSTIARLAELTALFGSPTRVKGAAGRALAEESRFDVPVPHCWVMQDGAESGGSTVAGQVAASVDAMVQDGTVEIVVGFALDNSEAADGEVDQVATVEAAIMGKLLGWRPEWASAGYQHLSTDLYGYSRARVVFDMRFAAARTVSNLS